MNGNWPYPKGGVVDTKNCVAVLNHRLSPTIPASKDAASTTTSSNPSRLPAPDPDGYTLTWRILDKAAVVGYVEVTEPSEKLLDGSIQVKPHYHPADGLSSYVRDALAMLGSRQTSVQLVAEPQGERTVYVGVDRMNVGVPSLPKIEVKVILALPNGKQSYIKVRVEPGKGYTVEAVNGELNADYKVTADNIMHLTAEQTPYYVKEALLLLSY